MKFYIVRHRNDEEFIEGEFNQRSILGIFKASNYLDLFNMLNEAINPYDLAFSEMPDSSGIFFTQGEIEFESVIEDTPQFSLEQVAFELTENLLKLLNEGAEWNIWVDSSQKVEYQPILRPHLLN